MCELLIKAADAPVSDGAGKWYAATIVFIADDGHSWGSAEGPPDFYILKVPGVSKVSAQQYVETWRHNPTYSIVNSQPAQDAYRIKLTTGAVSISGKGAITRAQVESFFTRWNAVIQSTTADSVTFDVSIYAALTSAGFWGRGVSGVTFSETQYNQATGSHLIEVISPQITDQQIQFQCEENAVSYVSPRSFIGMRADVRSQMQNRIAAKFKEMQIANRRWYVSQTGMTALQNAGGIMTVTPAQLVANLRDGFSD